MGEPNVDKLMKCMSSQMFVEWMAYYSLEPWCEDRADLRAGHTTAAVLNILRKGTLILADQFILNHKQAPQEQTTVEMKQVFKSFMAGVNRGNNR